MAKGENNIQFNKRIRKLREEYKQVVRRHDKKASKQLKAETRRQIKRRRVLIKDRRTVISKFGKELISGLLKEKALSNKDKQIVKDLITKVKKN